MFLNIASLSLFLMAILQHILVILVSFAGLGVGYLLALLSPEEMQPGRRYFLILEMIFRILAFIPVLYFSIMHSGLLFLLFFGGMAMSFFIRDFTLRLILLYIAFIPLILITAENFSIYMLQASFVFLYGLPAGTLMKILQFR